MGMFKLFSGSIADGQVNQPDPTHYTITRTAYVNKYLILQLKYKGCDNKVCNNYEGYKTLMYNQGVTVDQLKEQKSIDPHFSDSPDYISPIARFVPNELGWKMAVKLAEEL